MKAEIEGSNSLRKQKIEALRWCFNDVRDVVLRELPQGCSKQLVIHYLKVAADFAEAAVRDGDCQ